MEHSDVSFEGGVNLVNLDLDFDSDSDISVVDCHFDFRHKHFHQNYDVWCLKMEDFNFSFYQPSLNYQ